MTAMKSSAAKGILPVPGYLVQVQGEAMTKIHAPPNTQQRIDEVYMFVSVDETGEGVCAAPIGDSVMPLIAADEARLKNLIPIARHLSKLSGKTVKLIKLSQRTELMTISPDGGEFN